MVTPKHQACTKLVLGHADAVAGMQFINHPDWRARHLEAWKHPTKFGERATKLAIQAYALFADDYYDSFETEIGSDGYFGEHALGMLQAINASLSMGFKSRLDSGAINHLLHQLAFLSGVDTGAI